MLHSLHDFGGGVGEPGDEARANVAQAEVDDGNQVLAHTRSQRINSQSDHAVEVADQDNVGNGQNAREELPGAEVNRVADELARREVHTVSVTKQCRHDAGGQRLGYVSLRRGPRFEFGVHPLPPPPP